MLEEDVVRARMLYSFEQAATAFGVGLSTSEMMDALAFVTFGTALAWTLGMEEEEVQEAVRDAAIFVHRENPEQLRNFLQGWKAVGG